VFVDHYLKYWLIVILF